MYDEPYYVPPMTVDFVFRLPLYTLALCLSGIEYFLRTFIADSHRFEFLPTAIASAGLGFLVPLIVHDLPPPLLRALSPNQRRALSLLSSAALLFFFLGFVLWFALTGIAMQEKSVAELPNMGVFGWRWPFAWAFGFYLIGIFLTEIKARVLQ